MCFFRAKTPFCPLPNEPLKSQKLWTKQNHYQVCIWSWFFTCSLVKELKIQVCTKTKVHLWIPSRKLHVVLHGAIKSRGMDLFWKLFSITSKFLSIQLKHLLWTNKIRAKFDLLKFWIFFQNGWCMYQWLANNFISQRKPIIDIGRL